MNKKFGIETRYVDLTIPGSPSSDIYFKNRFFVTYNCELSKIAYGAIESGKLSFIAWEIKITVINILLNETDRRKFTQKNYDLIFERVMKEEKMYGGALIFLNMMIIEYEMGIIIYPCPVTVERFIDLYKIKPDDEIHSYLNRMCS